jgi:hypothetical protein
MASNSFKITDAKPITKNTLRGFFSLEFTATGMVIKDCMLHEKNGKQWIGFPGKPYSKADGAQSWVNIIDFVDTRSKYHFQDEVLPLVIAAFETVPPEFADLQW